MTSSSMRERGSMGVRRSACRIAPGPSSVAGPSGACSTIRRVPSSIKTSRMTSGTRSATPGSTCSALTASYPAASTCWSDPPARAESSIASQMIAVASGAFSRIPRSRWRRASSAAEKIRSRSSSQAVSLTGRVSPPPRRARIRRLWRVVRDVRAR